MTKLESAILYLLARVKKRGRNNLSKFELFKLLYLLEVGAYKYTGRSFLDDISFVREKNGPISFDVYNALSNLEGKYIQQVEVKKADYPFSRCCISLKKDYKNDNFSQSEKLFMNSIFEDYLDLSIKDLKALVYKTPPMKEIIGKEGKGKILKGYPVNFNSIPLDEEMVDLIAGPNE
ncbi:MAG: hypothetical protein A2Y67_01675 [Candidatus Buchananbacteria bacterium RBG_13_39_9]|uniref:Antitoxin SocA-like Panacea domain-containing protein n=1 Tax=Candidatus Buchananbacteria bacterium RBG_13_39_9 TaxID=1797531 RepID=A0A1G1XQ43_9BACT|nr:MAG: hypothetical protein A2Y67_01675 [Candidatus Buchananbacteria bacterium RBG_13_39_9]